MIRQNSYRHNSSYADAFGNAVGNAIVANRIQAGVDERNAELERYEQYNKALAKSTQGIGAAESQTITEKAAIDLQNDADRNIAAFNSAAGDVLQSISDDRFAYEGVARANANQQAFDLSASYSRMQVEELRRMQNIVDSYDRSTEWVDKNTLKPYEKGINLENDRLVRQRLKVDAMIDNAASKPKRYASGLTPERYGDIRSLNNSSVDNKEPRGVSLYPGTLNATELALNVGYTTDSGYSAGLEAISFNFDAQGNFVLATGFTGTKEVNLLSSGVGDAGKFTAISLLGSPTADARDIGVGPSSTLDLSAQLPTNTPLGNLFAVANTGVTGSLQPVYGFEIGSYKGGPELSIDSGITTEYAVELYSDSGSVYSSINSGLSSILTGAGAALNMFSNFNNYSDGVVNKPIDFSVKNREGK